MQLSRFLTATLSISLFAATAALEQEALGQDTPDAPPVTSVLQTAPSTSSEDIPPPAPVPDDTVAPTPAPQPVATAAPGQELRSFNFGISYAPTAAGLLVKGVIVGSPASATGVRPNDVIVTLDGEPATAAGLDGSFSSLEVQRRGSLSTLDVTSAPQGGGTANYVPQNRAAYSVPRTTYRVPDTTYSAPRRYAPVYEYAPGTAYTRPYSYRSYYGASRPRVSIGYSSGIGFGPGFGAYRGFGYGPGLRYGGFGPGFGYGRGVGVGFGRGFGGSGVSIGIGF